LRKLPRRYKGKALSIDPEGGELSNERVGRRGKTSILTAWESTLSEGKM